MTCPESRSWPRVAGLSLVCCGLVVAIALKIRPVSDESLAALFTEERTSLDRLVSVLAGNPAISCVQRHAESNDVLLATDNAGRWTPASATVPAAGEVQRLFDQLGCDYASRGASEITVAFRRNGIEDLHPGGCKVLAFCSAQPEFVVSSIDDFRRHNRGRYGCYRHLEGSWYIKYEQAH